MILYFDATKFPRSTTRAEWRAIDRWRRETIKRLAAKTARQVENLRLFGSTHPELSRRILDRLINPPVLVYDPARGA